jgi:hypothetical protein
MLLPVLLAQDYNLAENAWYSYFKVEGLPFIAMHLYPA